MERGGERGCEGKGWREEGEISVHTLWGKSSNETIYRKTDGQRDMCQSSQMAYGFLN